MELLLNSLLLDIYFCLVRPKTVRLYTYYIPALVYSYSVSTL